MEAVDQTVEWIQSQAQSIRDSPPSIGIVCGSGLGGLSSLLTAPVHSLAYADIPNLHTSTVQGHEGRLVFGMLGSKACVCMVGRFHYYEGHSPADTAFPIRVMRKLGISTLIVTNAAGGLNKSFNVGDIMVLADHISFAGLGGINPLIGPNLSAFGTRFPPMSDAYDVPLQKLAFKAAHACGILDSVHQGTYAFVPGPSFETRAESRYLRAAGADAVGMSTIPEVVCARHAGVRVLGLTLVTNRVAQGFPTDLKAELRAELGETGVRLDKEPEEMVASHEEVLQTGKARAVVMQDLVARIVDMI